MKQRTLNARLGLTRALWIGSSCVSLASILCSCSITFIMLSQWSFSRPDRSLFVSVYKLTRICTQWVSILRISFSQLYPETLISLAPDVPTILTTSFLSFLPTHSPLDSYWVISAFSPQFEKRKRFLNRWFLLSIFAVCVHF